MPKIEYDRLVVYFYEPEARFLLEGDIDRKVPRETTYTVLGDVDSTDSVASLLEAIGYAMTFVRGGNNSHARVKASTMMADRNRSQRSPWDDVTVFVVAASASDLKEVLGKSKLEPGDD